MQPTNTPDNQSPAEPTPGDKPDATVVGDGAAKAVKPSSGSRNLLLRSISALAVLGMTYGCLRWDVVNGSGWAWALLLSLASLSCLREFFRFAIGCEIEPFTWLGYLCGPAWILAQEWELSGASAACMRISPGWLIFLFFCVGTMLLQLTRRSNDNAMNNISVTVFGLIYCAILPGLGTHLRHLQLQPYGWPMNGIEFVVTCIFISKVSDVGALLTGKRWGKTKLIPRLSPGKTREGALGGLVFSIALLQFMVWVAPWMALAELGRPLLVLLSVLLAAGGLAGDLIESAFKRNSHRKDAGTGVPGFGGVLDMMDSLMVATPVMYFFLIACGAEYVKSIP